MAWDDVVVDGSTIDYAADHNAEITQIKSRLVGSLGAATPNTFVIVNAGGTGATPTSFTIDNLPLLKLGTPTQGTLQDWTNDTQSGGRVYGGVITDGGSGTINISALKGMIKIADYSAGVDAPSATKFFDLAGQTGWGTGATPAWLVNDSINYVYVDYATGTPTIKATTDRTTIRYTDQFTIGRVFKTAGGIAAAVEVLTSGINLENRTRRVHERWIDTFGGISRASGIIPSVSTSIGASPAWSLGIMYAGSNRINTPAVNCAAGGGGTFHSFYTANNGTSWVESAAINRIDWANYNNPASGLVALGGGKYGVHWMYVCPEGDMYFLYGKGNYTLAQAQAATVASPVPNYLSQWCLLVAKVIIKQDGTLDSVTSAWSNQFPVQLAGNHPDLSQLDYASAGHTGFCPNPTYDYLALPAGSASVPDTNPANYATNILSNNFPEISLGFSQTIGTQEGYWRLDIPEDTATPSGYTLLAKWSTTAATAATCSFLIYIDAIADGETNLSALTTLRATITDTNNGANYTNKSAESSTFYVNGTGKSFLIKAKRATNDALAAEAKLLSLILKCVRTKA